MSEHTEAGLTETGWVTVDDVAAHLKVAVKTLQNWRSRGEGPPSYTLGRRVVLYSLAEVDEWVRSCPTRTPVPVQVTPSGIPPRRRAPRPRRASA